MVPSLLVAAWLLITATCPSPLGAAFHVISGAEVYNRHGYVLLCILLVESAFGSEESFWDGVSSGTVLVLLGFLKLNFFGAAILLLLASLPFRWRDKQRALGFLLGTAATLTVFVLYLRFSVGSFLGDMSLALASRSSSLSRGAIFHWLLGSDKQVAGVFFATLALALLAVAGKRAQSKGIGILVSGLAVVLTGLIVWVTDFGETGIALAAVWLLLVVGHLSVVYAKSSEKFAINVVVLLCLSAIYMDFSDAARSYLALLKYGRTSRVGAGLSIANRNVEHMRFYEDENYPLLANNGSLYVQRINDGLALLDKVLTPGDRILTLGHNNPFPFILRLKPMRGGSTWLQPGSNVSLQHLMPTDRIFGDATILMVCYIDPDLPKAYAPFIEANFVQVARSPVWTVYRRRSL